MSEAMDDDVIAEVGMKPRVNEYAVVHRLRHSMRDRLRTAECQSDIIDQIGGWSSGKVPKAKVYICHIL